MQALTDAPLAFASTLEREQQFDEQVWRTRAEHSFAFLAWRGDRAVGTATGFPDPGLPADYMALVAMYVDPQARATGCSHRLIDAVAQAAGEAGARFLVLWVTEVNPVAAACYRRHGFVDTGRRKPLPHTGSIVETEMVLPLT